LTGNIIFIDAAAILESYPIVGDEYLYISFKSSPLAKEYNKIFKIIKLESVDEVPAKGIQLYTLHFVSTIADESLKRKLRVSFKNKKESEIIESICKNTLGVNKIEVEETLNERTFVIPNWSPLKTIKYLANTSIRDSNSRSASFLFYEDRNGFKFKSLETMMGEEAVAELTLDKNNYKKQTISSIKEFEIDNCFDIVSNSNNGYYGSTITEIDLIDKKVNTYNYTNETFLEDQDKIDDTGGYAIHGQSKSDGGDRPIVRVRNHTHANGNFNNAHNVMPRRMFMLQQFKNYEIDVTLPGNSNWITGSKILFNNPSLRKTTLPEDNKYITGNFICTETWHEITPSKHNMMITLRKPTFANEVEN